MDGSRKKEWHGGEVSCKNTLLTESEEGGGETKGVCVCVCVQLISFTGADKISLSDMHTHTHSAKSEIFTSLMWGNL